MSLALYRTYRPSRFADVIGQDHVTVPLMRALETDRLHHAYLFTGPRGCGKTSSARIMARSMNCEKGPTPDPCGTCQSCQDLVPNGPGSIDVIEMDAATYRGIAEAKDLRERASYAPMNSRYKIYIIDEAHQLTTDAFNVLLKLVEEPPPHLRFIFATTEPDKIIPTLRSRTHNYSFRLVSVRDLQTHMQKICDSENVKADPAALALIARAGAGSVRDSLSVLGQIVAGSGPDGITYAETVSQLGFTDEVILGQVINAIAAGDAAKLFELVDQVISTGHEPRRFVLDLLERMRDLMVLMALPDSASSGLLDKPQEQIEDLVAQAKLFTKAQLSRVANLVSEGISQLRGASAPRLQLELLLARLVTIEVTEDLEARVKKLELGEGASIPRPSARPTQAPAPTTPTSTPAVVQETSAPAPAAAPPAPPAPPARPARPAAAPPRKPSEVKGTPEPVVAQASGVEPTTAQVTGNITIENLRNSWPMILEAVKAQRRVVWMQLSDSMPLSLSADGILSVGFKDIGTVKAFGNNGNDKTLQLVLQEVMKIDVRIQAVHEPNSVAPQAKSIAETSGMEDASPEDAVTKTSDAVSLLTALGGTVTSETPREQ